MSKLCYRGTRREIQVGDVALWTHLCIPNCRSCPILIGMLGIITSGWLGQLRFQCVEKVSEPAIGACLTYLGNVRPVK